MFDQTLFRFSFERDKALEVLIYISSQVQDMYHVLKILYFADIDHLSKYGRFINGDTYIAMNAGPVPSESYDIIRSLRGIGISQPNENEIASLKIEQNSIIPLREPDLTVFSKSDINCLNQAIEKYKSYSFDDLHKESSGIAYRNADLNSEMDIFSIAGELPNGNEIIEYLRTQYAD